MPVATGDQRGHGRVAKTLTRKQAVFVEHFLIRFNGKEAAVAAGVPPAKAANMASQWLDAERFPQVQAEIERVLAERKAKAEVKAEQVIAEYAKIAFMDPRKLFGPDGRLLTAKELPDDVACAVRSLKLKWQDGVDENGEPVTYRVADIDFHDKLTALGMLAKHLGIDKSHLGGGGTTNINVAMINWEQVIPHLGAAKPPDPYEEKLAAIGPAEPKLKEEKQPVKSAIPTEFARVGKANTAGGPQLPPRVVKIEPAPPTQGNTNGTHR